jgi:hypothetical protein
MAQDTTLAHGKPGIASFASESYGGPGEPRYGEGIATTTHHTVSAGADIDLPIYSVVSVLLGVAGVPVLALHDPTASGVSASGTITVSSTGPSNAETFVVGSQTYTFKTALSTGPAVANEILIHATPATQAAYIAAAINGTTSVGSSSLTAANPEAYATVSGAVVTVRANVPGDEGNGVVLTESAANVAVSGSGTLASGSDEFDIKAFGILAAPITMTNGQTMSVPFYREGVWDIDQLNWHASYLNDEQKLNAFIGSASPGLFLQKKKFSNDDITF